MSDLNPGSQARCPHAGEFARADLHADASPYADELALAHSGYAAWSDGALRRPDGEAAPALSVRVHDALRALILDPDFPCVGARSALNQASYRFALYDELDTEEATAGLARDLYRFVQEQPALGGEFATFLAVFDAPKVVEPVRFERLLWSQLERLHHIDESPWDSRVSSDVRDPTFSFSFAGQAFFIVGLSPSGGRWARTFPWPLLAFNPHAQFEELRAQGRFERMQDVIRERDLRLEGHLNPNLENFGEHTEARQYSGRPVGEDWVCPVTFRDRPQDRPHP